jgi:hypothetical protein
VASVYSKQLVNFKGLSSGELDVPMPVDKVWVIRAIDVYRNNVSSNELLFSLLDEGVAFFAINDPIDTSGSYHQDMRLVMYSGSPGGFKVVASGLGAYDFVVSGYELTLP